MKPDHDPLTTHRLDEQPGRSLLGTALAIIAGSAALVLGFMFSLLILLAAMVIGLLGFGYLWWKSRALRGQMQEQMDHHARHSSDEPVPGDIIEGEVIREEREPPK